MVTMGRKIMGAIVMQKMTMKTKKKTTEKMREKEEKGTKTKKRGQKEMKIVKVMK